VRYAETDQMGVVYHANYLIWMEIGRTEYAKSVGIRYADLERAGYLMTVVEANVRYADAARYDDDIVIRTRIEAANPRMITFRYDLEHAEGPRPLATGTTKHFFCSRSPEGLRPTKLPEEYHAFFGIARR
jgi:acyl-CoA thioester hydrolase